jgi:hypothetical protein
MRSLRASFVITTLLVLSASSVQAQSGKIACKDGSKPKIGHFSCWGHGGLVTGAVKKDKAAQKKAESNVVQAGKPKAEKKKTHAKKTKKAHTKKTKKSKK